MMKKIIVPTDFSRNAHRAAEYAVQMALRHGDKIVLIHAFEVPVAVSEYGIPTVHFETVKKQIEQRLETEKTALWTKYGKSVSIETLAVNGHLIEHISDLYVIGEIKLVVIGLTGSGMANFFLGSNTLNIVNGVAKAVLTVPPFAHYKPVKKILFAFDASDVEVTLPAKRLRRLAGALAAELLILNVVQSANSSNEEERQRMEKVEQMMNGISYSYHSVETRQVVDGIRSFSMEQQADLLAIVPREYGFIENLLGENHTKSLLFRSSIPILTVPPDDLK